MPKKRKHIHKNKNKIVRKSWSLFTKIEVLQWLRGEQKINVKINCHHAVEHFVDHNLELRPVQTWAKKGLNYYVKLLEKNKLNGKSKRLIFFFSLLKCM